MKKFLRTKDVGGYFGVSETTVRNWMKWLPYEVKRDATGFIYAPEVVRDLEGIRDQINRGERPQTQNTQSPDHSFSLEQRPKVDTRAFLQMIEMMRLQLNTLEVMIKALR